MKQFALTILIVVQFLITCAQDTIFFNDGSHLAVRLVDLSRPTATYKVYGYSDGPTISSDYFRISHLKLETGETLVQENGDLRPFLSNEKSRFSSINRIPTEFGQFPSSSNEQPDTVFVEVPVESEVSQNPEPDYMDKVLKLTGPRVGATYFTNGKVDFSGFDNTNPLISQFGWQFETRYFTLKNGTQGLIEFVGLIGGMDQGLFLPSANVLIGVRDAKGFEFGFGPSLSVGGAAFVLAAGMSFRTENVYIPVNLAFTASPKNPRISLLVGFNGRKR
jgi:hypothetical protein